LPERIAHLYACQGLSTYKIGAMTGIGRQRVTRLRRRAGIPVKPRGAGRRRSTRDHDAERFDALMADMYLRLRMPSTQIAELTGIPGRSVRDRLRASGVPMRTRGQYNREDRIAIDPDDLAGLYLRAGLSAGEIGRLLGVSRHVVLRSAHDHGLPVRVGGPPPRRGPSEIELITALYADSQVRKVLRRHGVPHVPEAGPLWQRFPRPHRLTADLVTDLYTACGLGLHHIELVTGQPAATVTGLLRASGVPLRPPGGRTPFMRRWRNGQSA
jgi:DNA-binding CsgD family transcriptional regulator